MRISCTGPTGITEQFIKESDSVLIGRQLPPGPESDWPTGRSPAAMRV